MSNLAKLNQIQPSNLVPGLRLYVSLNLNEPYFPTTKRLSSQSIRGQPVATRRVRWQGGSYRRPSGQVLSLIRPASDSDCARVLHSLQDPYIFLHLQDPGDPSTMNRQTGILPLSMSIVACILLVAASSASGTGVVPTGLQVWTYLKVLVFFFSILSYSELVRIEIFWPCRTSGIFCEARCIRWNGCLQYIARHDVQDNVLICFCQQKNVERSGITSTHRNMHTRSHAHAHARAHTLYVRNFVVCAANTCCSLQYIIIMITNFDIQFQFQFQFFTLNDTKSRGGSTGTGQA